MDVKSILRQLNGSEIMQGEKGNLKDWVDKTFEIESFDVIENSKDLYSNGDPESVVFTIVGDNGKYYYCPRDKKNKYGTIIKGLESALKQVRNDWLKEYNNDGWHSCLVGAKIKLEYPTSNNGRQYFRFRFIE